MVFFARPLTLLVRVFKLLCFQREIYRFKFYPMCKIIKSNEVLIIISIITVLICKLRDIFYSFEAVIAYAMTASTECKKVNESPVLTALTIHMIIAYFEPIIKCEVNQIPSPLLDQWPLLGSIGLEHLCQLGAEFHTADYLNQATSSCA